MAVGFFDWQLYGPTFADPAMATIFSEDATIAAWLKAEQALAKAQANLDLIPADAADLIARLSPDQIDKARLAGDVEQIGRPIVGLVRQIRGLVPDNVARWVHYRGTTQDIMDTALVLQIQKSLARIEQQLLDLDQAFGALARSGAGLMMAGRTNGQHAQPIPFSDKIRVLASEVRRHVDRLRPLRDRVLQVQLGGAVGTLSAFGEKGRALRQAFAAELGLGVGDGAWQSSRDRIAETALWLSLIAQTVEKVGWNFGNLISSDLGELRLRSAKGESSAMPHKNNPRHAEFAEALARLARQRALSVVETGRHEHERSGGAWIAEWMLVPEAFLLTSACLLKANKLVREAEPDQERMRANLAGSLGTLASEALVDALAEKLGWKKAREIVSTACDRAVDRRRNLLDELMSDPRLSNWIDRNDLKAVIDIVYSEGRLR